MNTNKELRDFLNKQLADTSQQNKVKVFPLNCGVGKSQFIKQFIADTINNKADGAIIVTDSISRMDDYLNMTENELENYIYKIRKNVSILKNETIADELQKQYSKPILLMSTQRYFNLKREEIEAFTKYKKGRRTRIIFDERPYFYETRQITIATFNDVDTALHMALDNTTEGKEWLICQWENLRTHIQVIMKNYERQNNDYELCVFHYLPGDRLSEDDEKFISLIEKYRLQLNRFDINTYNDILTIKEIIYNGANFISQKIKKNDDAAEYKNYFALVIDNVNKLLNLGAKVYVLDGTADIKTPNYDVYYADFVDCSKFKFNLKNLTINIVNVSTSKTRLCKKNNPLIKTIRTYIDTLPYDDSVVFTYKAITKYFSDDYKTNHFGNIKGRNNYRNSTHFIQIGLNRYPDTLYFLEAGFLSCNDMNYENRKMIRVVSKNKIIDVMNRNILTDIEQNLYRSKIRNYDNQDEVIYTLLFNTQEYSSLVKIIQNRYQSYGATINIIDTPLCFQTDKIVNRKTKNETIAQKVIRYIESLEVGTIFKRADIISNCGLTVEQFKNIKKNNEVVKITLNLMKTSKQGIYEKN